MELTIDTGKMLNYNIPQMKEFVQQAVDELMKLKLFDLGITSVELERKQNKKSRLQAALNDCIYGSKPDKEFVKEFIKELLQQYYDITSIKINNIIPFERVEHLSVQDKFDILLHVYKKEYGYKALSVLIRKYDLDLLRKTEDVEYFFIDMDDINRIYKRESPVITYEDKYNIIVQRVYSLYKGYNVIDDIMDMQVDGLSCGVNGLPESFVQEHKSEYESVANTGAVRSYESIWLYFQGKSIHLKFLSLGSYDELQRVCQNVYKYGYPGQLSKVDGFKVNKLKDGSRVVVLRPDFCETWCFFIRKFDLPDISLPGLIKDKNCDLVIELIGFLVKGSMNTSVTGAQGSGKTTLLRAMIEHIYTPYTLRILEMAFELHVRKSYPNRNIVTIQETDAITGQAGLDVLKKTDGVVTIVGEVATDPVAAYMIQTAQVASLFTLFSHHAKKFPDLVMSLRNSLLKTNVFNNERIAEEQIISVLNFDIHMEKDISGKRYIERITECIPFEPGDFDIDDCSRNSYKTNNDSNENSGNSSNSNCSSNSNSNNSNSSNSSNSSNNSNSSNSSNNSSNNSNSSNNRNNSNSSNSSSSNSSNDNDPSNLDRLIKEAQYRYYERMLGGHSYTYRNIIEYDLIENAYVVKNRISDSNRKAMAKAMLREDQKLFAAFLDKEFGNLEESSGRCG
jgi:pilus assembly protein CpaF